MLEQCSTRKTRFLRKKHLLVLAPCLIGAAVISPTLASMVTGDAELTQNALEFPPISTPETTVVPPQPVAAKPVQSGLKKSGSAKNKTHAAIKKREPIKAAPIKSSDSNPKSAKKVASQTAPQPKARTVPQAQPQHALTVRSYAPSTANDVPNIPIRVAIVRDAQRLSVATSEAGVVTDGSGRVIQNVTAQTSVGVYPTASGLNVGQVQMGAEVWIKANSDSGLVFVNGKWYRGAVRLIQDQGQILAVNHVEMQPYLYSVVGAEMYKDWPGDALKAQAIAARSYALVHIVRPASDYYDLGNTERWQAYKGVETEATSTLAAVDATKGMIISHNGGVVETLYASTNSLVREAHSGYGMSQYGARDLASQNLTYSQILSRFYPGTQLALLQAE